MPGTGAWTLAGSGGSGSAARGRTAATRDATALARVVSQRADASAAPPTTTTPPTPSSTPRRLTDGTSASSAAGTALPTPVAAVATAGGATSDGLAMRSNHHSARAAATPATSAGSGARTESTGRSSAAIAPTTPPMSITWMPHTTRSRERAPAQAARAMTATTTTATTTDLDAVPKVDVAHSFTACGGRSMAVDATTSTGAYAGSMKAATRVPAATPNPAASTPRSAKSHVGLEVRCSSTTVTLTRSRYVESAGSASGRPADQRSNST